MSMGRNSPTKRSVKIKQAQQRGKKLRKLREKYAKAEVFQKEKILEKLAKVAPQITKKGFEESVKKLVKEDDPVEKS